MAKKSSTVSKAVKKSAGKQKPKIAKKQVIPQEVTKSGSVKRGIRPTSNQTDIKRQLKIPEGMV